MSTQRGVKLLIYCKGDGVTVDPDTDGLAFNWKVGPKSTMDALCDRVRSRFHLFPKERYSLLFTNGDCDWEDAQLWDQIRLFGNLTDVESDKDLVDGGVELEDVDSTNMTVKIGVTVVEVKKCVDKGQSASTRSTTANPNVGRAPSLLDRRTASPTHSVC